MKTYIINIQLIIVFLLYSNLHIIAQQEAQYTQYMYNTSIINPAYTGSEETFKITLLHRSQWINVPGAPITQTLNIEGILKENLGFSLNVSKDAIGPSEDFIIDANIAYHIQLNAYGKLALGLKAGMSKFSLDLTKGNLNPNQTLATSNNVNKTFSRVGAGLYYYADRTYRKIAIAHLLETKYENLDLNINYSFKNHYYIIAGTIIDIGSNTRFKPALLAKVASGAPLSLDLSANFLLNEKFILGAAYRLDAAVSGLLGFYASNSIFLGYAYDYTTNFKNEYTGGTHEICIRINFSRSSIYKSPRFF